MPVRLPTERGGTALSERLGSRRSPVTLVPRDRDDSVRTSRQEGDDLESVQGKETDRRRT